MKFHVHILGFSEFEGGIIEIFPTSNEFDIGAIDLYTLETSFNDIKFQTRYNNDIFGYYPATNNTPYTLKTNLLPTTTTCSLTGTQLVADDTLWIGNERVRIDNVNGGIEYDIERGFNSSIPTFHFYSPIVDGVIPTTIASTKRLSPLGLICKFFSTDNIGGDIKILAYGQISSVNMSNNRLLNITCTQLYKTLKKPIIFNYFSINTSIELFQIIDPDSIHLTTEFLQLLDIPPSFYVDCNIELKLLSDKHRVVRKIELEKIFLQFCILNNSFIKLNTTTGRYEFIKLSNRTSIDQNPTSIFISSYLSLKDSNINVKIFERVASLNLKYKVGVIIDSKIQSSDFEHTLVDDVIGSVSSKSIEVDFSELIFTPYISHEDIYSLVKNKITSLNQIYDILEITSTKWFKPFTIGTTYYFNDQHIIKTLVNKVGNIGWTCIGYEDGKATFYSDEFITHYLVSFMRGLYYVSGSNWQITNLSNTISTGINTLVVGDILEVYTYDNLAYSYTISQKTITGLSMSGSDFIVTLSGLSTNTSQYTHSVTLKSLTSPTGRYNYFLYENNNTI